MVYAIVIADFVNLQSVHAGMYLFCHFVEHSCVDDAATLYSFYFFGSSDEVTCRNLFTFVFPIHYLLVKLSWLLS